MPSAGGDKNRTCCSNIRAFPLFSKLHYGFRSKKRAYRGKGWCSHRLGLMNPSFSQPLGGWQRQTMKLPLGQREDVHISVTSQGSWGGFFGGANSHICFQRG